MNKTDYYRNELKKIKNWEPFLLENSGLPGRRANIELARAVSLEGEEEIFLRYIAYDDQIAPMNNPTEFLPFCGTLGLGELLKDGKVIYLPKLKRLANDSRWRIREAVAMALQRYGEENMDSLIDEMVEWAIGSRFEQRAAAAAICEPGLLSEERYSQSIFAILERITSSLQNAQDRKSEDFRILRKGLGYCWSVATAAYPDVGMPKMEKWFTCEDVDVRWVMRENLKKNRLKKLDLRWSEEWEERLK